MSVEQPQSVSPPPARPPIAAGGPPRPRRIRRYIVLGIGVALAVYVGSGFYFVQPNERGVVRWFGRVPPAFRSVPAGLHYAVPWPIARVDRPRTTEIRRVFVGLQPETRSAIARGDAQAQAASPASDVLTGDVNILKVTMAVQYQVAEPTAFLFAAKQPDQLVAITVQAALFELLSDMSVDDALTSGKAALQNGTLARAQQRLDTYGCGVRLLATNLETIDPPQAIAAAFNDVVSAKKDGERAIDRATAEANRILPRARGEAVQATEQAAAYQQTRISRARGETARFLSVLAEYRKAPEITRQRMRLQTFERVAARIRLYILDNQPGAPPARLRIIDSGSEQRALPEP